MMMYGDGMAWAMAFGLVVWIGVIGLAGWVLGRYLSASRAPRAPRTIERETPLEILERRYAEGAIDTTEFDDARARIREDDLRH
jgi:putative membrane protein